MYFLSTPVTVNVRVSRNDSLHFPVLSLCNKNLFNLTAMDILKNEKAAQLLATDNTTVVSQSQFDKWDIPDLIGVRGYDATQVWDFIAHRMSAMIMEVS